MDVETTECALSTTEKAAKDFGKVYPHNQTLRLLYAISRLLGDPFPVAPEDLTRAHCIKGSPNFLAFFLPPESSQSRAPCHNQIIDIIYPQSFINNKKVETRNKSDNCTNEKIASEVVGTMTARFVIRVQLSRDLCV